MAFAAISRALDPGGLKVGHRICEYTGGSKGTSIAFVSCILGLKFTAVTSTAFAASKIKAIRTYGADALLPASADSRI